MDWFGEQLKKRKQNEKSNLEETFLGVAGAILGKSLEQSLKDNVIVTQALGYVLKYYHIHYEEKHIPKEIKDVNEQVDYICRPRGVLHREVLLTGKWYKDAIGPMLGTLKEDNRVVALIPNKTFGYSYYDVKTGNIVRVNKKTALLLNNQATYFYQPLPFKKLKIIDLLKFMIQQLNPFDIFLFFFILVVTTLLGVVPPYFTQWLFSFVVARKDLLVLFSLSTFMVTFSLCTIMIQTFKTFIDNRVSTKISIALEAAVMQRTISFEPSFYQKYAAGDLSQRKGCVLSLANSIFSSIFTTSITSVFSLTYLGQMTSYAPSLVVVSLLIILVNVIYSLIVIFSNMKISQKRLQVSIEEAAMSYAMINGIQKIKLSGAEKRMFSRWGKLYTNKLRLDYNPPFFIKYSSILGTIISTLGTFIFYFIAINSQVGVANFLAFNSAYGSVSAGITSLAGIAGSIGQLRPTYNIAKPILDAAPEMNENKPNVSKLSGYIELSNVSFKYDESGVNVIDNLSLQIRSNDYVAIVGTTGCGKSTLIKLLLGFVKPQRGNIYYDKVDINRVNAQSLRQKIGTVMQNAKLFNADILTNITISAPWISEQEAWEAARIAAIDDDIRAMPMGMKTIISEGQGGISGGQRQRLAIARAVASKPKIMIFDEATSALDNITQKKVSDAIDKLHCTRIVVAHRLTTIRNCNRIVVLDKGHIVEDGTYEELIKKNGTFAELVKRQRLDLNEEEVK